MKSTPGRVPLKRVLAIAALVAAFAVPAASAGNVVRSSADTRLAEKQPDRVCAQVVSCGTKDGKRREYPTPCAASDDGATNIAPKTAPTCEEQS